MAASDGIEREIFRRGGLRSKISGTRADGGSEDEVDGANPLTFDREDGGLEHALKLSNISGPAMGEEARQGSCGEALDGLAVFRGIAGEKEVGEQRNVLVPLA